jgi:hypothetical protein
VGIGCSPVFLFTAEAAEIAEILLCVLGDLGGEIFLIRPVDLRLLQPV